MSVPSKLCPIIERCPTARFDIFMAGDIAAAKQVCRQHCFEVGLCDAICNDCGLNLGFIGAVLEQRSRTAAVSDLGEHELRERVTESGAKPKQ